MRWLVTLAFVFALATQSEGNANTLAKKIEWAAPGILVEILGTAGLLQPKVHPRFWQQLDTKRSWCQATVTVQRLKSTAHPENNFYCIAVPIGLPARVFSLDISKVPFLRWGNGREKFPSFMVTNGRFSRKLFQTLQTAFRAIHHPLFAISDFYGGGARDEPARAASRALTIYLNQPTKKVINVGLGCYQSSEMTYSKAGKPLRYVAVDTFCVFHTRQPTQQILRRTVQVSHHE